MMEFWAESHISAAHRDESGNLHGHTWRVRAFWVYDNSSVERRRDQLADVCGLFDHTTLPDNLSRAEELADHIGRRMGCSSVEIWRDAERVGCRWTQ